MRDRCENWVAGSLYDGSGSAGPCVINCTNLSGRGIYSFHPQGCNVGRQPRKVGAQPRIGQRQIIRDQCRGRIHQVRIFVGRLEIARPRLIRPVRIAHEIQLVGQQPTPSHGTEIERDQPIQDGARFGMML